MRGLAALTRFLRPYYIIHSLTILGYVGARIYGWNHPALARTNKTWTGLSEEMEIVVLATVMVASKYKKIATFDELLGKAFLFGKLGVGALLYKVNMTWCAWYLAFNLALWLALRPPRHAFSADITDLTPATFEENARKLSRAKRVTPAWIVMFHADWSSASTNLEPMFGELARKYGSEDRQFARMDLVSYPEVAEDLNIDMSGSSSQIPTLALFYKGKEIARLPTFDSSGGVVRTRMDERGVTKYFELDKPASQASYAISQPKRTKKK
ncbi:unnamed protein product [Chrysoparadoxa australica]